MGIKCIYCRKHPAKPYKTGPNLFYCNYDCFVRNCLTKDKESPIYTMVARMYPKVAAKMEVTK